MTRRTAIRIASLSLTIFVMQAAYLLSTDRRVLLTVTPKPAYIYEGDLVSDTPPENADRDSRTVTANWELCRYWTGLTIKTVFLPSGNCTAITL